MKCPFVIPQYGYSRRRLGQNSRRRTTPYPRSSYVPTVIRVIVIVRKTWIIMIIRSFRIIRVGQFFGEGLVGSLSLIQQGHRLNEYHLHLLEAVKPVLEMRAVMIATGMRVILCYIHFFQSMYAGMIFICTWGTLNDMKFISPYNIKTACMIINSGI